MLMCHKIIDALLGKSDKYKTLPVPGLNTHDFVLAAECIRKAQKFDFGDLMCEPDPEFAGRWMLPKLTHDEREFWRTGLIPLPYQWCWYEFVLGTTRTAILVNESNSGWDMTRFDLVEDHVLMDGVVIRIDPADCGTDEFRVSLGGNKMMLRQIAAKMGDLQSVGMTAPLVIYLTLMLNSKTTEVEVSKAPKFLNKKRDKKGLEPLAEHRIVKIVPVRYLRDRDPVTGIERRSPRLHWRRSHLRHLSTGKVIVIARMLVGRAELGEVSHEYQIKEA